jgi:hypothetical protein
VVIRAARVLEQVVVHRGVDLRHDARVGELHQEVVDEVFAHVRDVLLGRVADVDHRGDLGLGRSRGELAVGLVDGGDEGRGVGAEELAERHLVGVERHAVGDARQALGDLLGERPIEVVDQVVPVLQARLPEDLEREADLEPAAVRGLDLPRGRRGPRVAAGRLEDVVHRHPLHEVAAVLHRPVEDLPRAAIIAAGLPQRVLGLDRMQRVQVQPADPHRRRAHGAQSREPGGVGGRPRRHVGVERVAEAIAEQLEHLGDAVLRAQAIAGVDHPAAGVGGHRLDAVALGAAAEVGRDLDAVARGRHRVVGADHREPWPRDELDELVERRHQLGRRRDGDRDLRAVPARAHRRHHERSDEGAAHHWTLIG